MAVAKKVLIEKELIKNFRHIGTFLDSIPSRNKWVKNDTIKLNEIGVDPAVLINNTTYPIPTSSRTDNEQVISLHKYDTENTKVTDDEIYALAYDKQDSVLRQHRMTLEEKTLMHSLHSLCPATDTPDTPVLETTGTVDATGRKRLVMADIIALKLKLDKLKVPLTGRALVLSPEHCADLLLEDLSFKNLMQNRVEGSPAPRIYGFQIFECTYAPQFVGGNKAAFAALPTGTEKNASVAMYLPNTAKARGTVKIYLKESSEDPDNRETRMGARLYHICLPLKLKGQAAIIDG